MEIAKVGGPWKGDDIETWPGVSGIPGESNYLEYNTNPFLPDPENTSITHNKPMKGGKKAQKSKKMKGGKKAQKGKKSKKMKGGMKAQKSKKMKGGMKAQKGKKSKKIKRGGSHHGSTLLPQSIVDLGRNLQYNIEGIYSAFTGSSSPVNPDPMVQPIGSK
jgi:hypothetical protein